MAVHLNYPEIVRIMLGALRQAVICAVVGGNVEMVDLLLGGRTPDERCNKLFVWR